MSLYRFEDIPLNGFQDYPLAIAVKVRWTLDNYTLTRPCKFITKIIRVDGKRVLRVWRYQ